MLTHRQSTAVFQICELADPAQPAESIFKRLAEIFAIAQDVIAQEATTNLALVEQDDEEDPAAWWERLIYDFAISETSPVVKGTWVTAGHVVSLIVDGWTWCDILRAHPDLTEDDLRACLAFTIEEDRSNDETTTPDRSRISRRVPCPPPAFELAAKTLSVFQGSAHDAG